MEWTEVLTKEKKKKDSLYKKLLFKQDFVV